MFDSIRVPGAHRGGLSAEALEELFSGGGDFVSRRVRAGDVWLDVCWLDGCSAAGALAETVLRPLGRLRAVGAAGALRLALAGGVWAGPVRERSELRALAEDLSLGSAAVFFPGTGRALSVEVKASPGRDVESASVEKSVMGAREAFTETLRTNTALVRRRLPGSALKLRELRLGTETRTAVDMLYLEGAAPAERAEEVWRRLQAVSVPGVTAAGALERALSGSPRGSFPQCVHTERPDRMVRGLLRGQVGVLCDGLPVALLLPVTAGELFSVEEDRSRHAAVSTVLLWLRLAALGISLLLPAVYTAAAMYHPEMIPHPLLQSMIRARAEVPFSTAAEVLGMLFSFELIQEAGVRLPEPVGQTVSLIGALIVGESAVQAKLLSPLVIIVVALAGIGGYAQPSQELGAAVRLWRAALVVLAALLGLFGVVAGCTALLWRLCGTENLGVCWLYPLCDGTSAQALRSLYRSPAGREDRS